MQENKKENTIFDDIFVLKKINSFLTNDPDLKTGYGEEIKKNIVYYLDKCFESIIQNNKRFEEFFIKKRIEDSEKEKIKKMEFLKRESQKKEKKEKEEKENLEEELNKIVASLIKEIIGLDSEMR